jgi:hypothetical protein
MANRGRLFKYILLFVCFIGIPGSYACQATGLDSGEFNLFEQNGKFGLKDGSGQVVIAPHYDALGWSNGKFSIIDNITGYKLNGGWGLISTSNHRITKAIYEDLSPATGVFLVARKKNDNSVKIQAGCINTSGKTIIPFSYDGISIASLRAIVYTKNGNRFNHGLVDFENKLLIPLNYQAIYPLGSLRFAVQNFENKTAIFSEEGKQLAAFVIDSISSFKKNLAVVYQNHRQGLIDRNGQVKLEPVFRQISIEDDGSVRARQPDSWLFLNGENKLLRQFNADSVVAISKRLYKVKIGDNFFLTDEKLQPINELVFSKLEIFYKGTARFERFGKYGLLHADGSVAIPSLYSELFVEDSFVRAARQISNQTRWLLLDTAGKTIAPKNYEFIAPFNGSFFPVKNKNFWGAINSQGQEIIACVHDSIIQHVQDHIVVQFKGNYGIINLKEDWVVTPQTFKLTILDNERYIQQTERTTFLKSFPSNIIFFTDNPVEIQPDHLREYLPSGAIWKIDLNGVIADRFVQLTSVERVFPEQEGLRAIKKDGKFGFVDSRNRLRIANRYEDVKSFHEGLAAIMIRGKWGFINKEDKIAIQPVYDEVFSFIEGFALVKQKNLFGLIDKSGKPILPIRYDDIKILDSKRLLISQNNLYGLADARGKVLINPKYDTATDLNNGYVIVSRDGKFGLLTTEGLSTIPLIYDGLTYDRFHDEYLALKKSESTTININ